jgi:thioredoxin reductase (NADPH)
VTPNARRVLLTAYADTDAAIRAINDVDLDRYLLKPWDPPEERLYPALDELLEAWAAQARPSFEGLTVLGHQWSVETQELKEFLARNAVPFRHLDVRQDEGQRLLKTAGLADEADAAARRPAARRRGAAPAVAPGRGSAGGALDHGGPPVLRRRRRRRRAGGARGCGVRRERRACARCSSERAATGGQAGQSSRIENYLGFPHGLSGAELAQRARDQAPPLRRRDPHGRRGGGRRSAR